MRLAVLRAAPSGSRSRSFVIRAIGAQSNIASSAAWIAPLTLQRTNGV
jgi:hypothetical protein